MANEESLPIPLDIPWQLAATTQKRHAYEPFDSTISIFYYEPKMDTLAAYYPDQRIIYVKAVVSIGPAKLPADPEKGDADWPEPPIEMSDYLAGLSGVWHALLDLHVRTDPDTMDVIRPYFHAAAPVSREMIETGVIGNDQTEGTSNSIAVGKSASTLHETIFSSARTSSSGQALDLKAISFSHGSSSTNVATDRTLNETIDTTQRQASQERRELLSHHTNINNVLSLLSAMHIGSPYVRFSLSPRPISLLSLDPGDPNLWYMELLRRRSSGLEGIQEFFLVVVVPKDRDFCIFADLKRFFVADRPPVPPTLDKDFGLTKAEQLEQEAVVLDYLYKRFPRGTPLDDLDRKIEINQKDYPNPAVWYWFFVSEGGEPWVDLLFISPARFITSFKTKPKYPPHKKAGYTYYMSGFEAYLEAVTAKYEEDLARSPLERGIVLMKETTLRTCLNQDGSVEYEPGVRNDWGLPPASNTSTETNDISYGTATFLVSRAESPTRRGRTMIARWNELQRAFSRHLESAQVWSSAPVALSDSRVYVHFLSSIAALDPSDPRDLSMSQLMERLDLPAKVRSQLARSSLKSFRDLARYLLVAPVLERTAELPPRGTTPPRTTQRLPFNEETRVVIEAAIRKEWSTTPKGGQPEKENVDSE
jgi:hypothetical protein